MPWTIDVSHSHIQFSVRHMMISKVRGNFERFSGTVDFNEAEPSRSTVDVKIEVASLNTKDEKRDAHLKSPDFLDAPVYPEITFKSKRVEPVDDSHGRLIGDLRIKDVTREVVLDVEYAGQARSPWGTQNAGFSAQTKINRKDWGLNWNVALETGGWLVSDELTIDIELEIVKQQEQSVGAQEAAAVA